MSRDRIETMDAVALAAYIARLNAIIDSASCSKCKRRALGATIQLAQERLASLGGRVE